jgi:hypothetical protein
MRIILGAMLVLAVAAGAVFVIAPDDIFARSCVETNTCP